MNKPSIKILKESAETFGCENLASGSIKAAVDSLHDFFVEEYGEDELAKCPVCTNMSPEKDKDGEIIPSCPYCGATFSDAPAVDEPKPSKATKKPKGRVAKKRGTEEEKEEYIATPEQKEELAEHVSRISELRQNVAQNTYDLGGELNQINDKGLWRGLGYGSFFEYCKAELDFSRASAYKYMLVSREFDRDTFLVVGVKKGELIAGAPERHQKKLLNAAKKGKTFSELRAQLDKLDGRSRGGSGVAGKGSERVTLLGKVKKGEDIEIQWLSSKSHKPITRKDVKGKYAILPLTDEVEAVLVPADNELGMVAQFRKAGEESSDTTDASDTSGEEE
jgi:uncharacterized Zn finger protein (UPF0148 family)